jgi:hypothetical protein
MILDVPTSDELTQAGLGYGPALPADQLVAGREICWFTRLQKWPKRIGKDMLPPPLMRFFLESPLWPTDSFMSHGK